MAKDRSEYRKRFYAEHRDEEKQQRRQYYRKHQAEQNAYSQAYYRANSGKWEEYRKKHPKPPSRRRIAEEKLNMPLDRCPVWKKISA